MRWKGREQSSNVEDRRGSRGVKLAGGGGLAAIVVILIAFLFGADPRPLLNLLNQGAQNQNQGQQRTTAIDDEAKEFVSVVLKDTENVWRQLFRDQVDGSPEYDPPILTLFSGTTRTACGMANSATGPFYCPADQHVYIDPDFFEQMRSQLNAPGDFAQAYVIAHEVAHHVQNSLGLMRDLNRARQTRNKRLINRNSVRVELQADYLAGVWAHHAQKNYRILESGDIEEAINAANQIGDDTLQKMSGGYVIPERFTHGTSAQRVKWFSKGLKSGSFAGCLQLMELEYDDL